MTTVLVTGSNGQLGQCIKDMTPQFPSINFLFVGKNTLDITDTYNVLEFFKTHTIDWCINCAAYTAVDKAENDQDKAYQINVLGARNIAQACHKYGAKMIHISTDFVFDGLKTTPYKETDPVNPQSIYGSTKLDGEKEVQKNCHDHFIIRTSWLYSEFGHNFLKTMLKMSSERETLTVVDDQIGSPTYGRDLAEVLMQIIVENKTNYGIFHYSNRGQVSWFDFAKGIFDLNESTVNLAPTFTKYYVTLAKRPQYSVLDTSKISEVYNLKIPFWKDSLTNALYRIGNK